MNRIEQSFRRLCLTLLLCLVSTAATPPSLVRAAAEAATCEVGAYMISLYEFNLVDDSFSADFWFWSTCEEDLRPLDAMDFPTAKHVEKTLPATLQRDDKFWSYLKVSGVFRHNWDIRNFPFDRHELAMEIEHTAAPASQFRYTADVAGSKVNPEIRLDAWRVTDFSVHEYVYIYNTVFGDPAFDGEEVSDYARMKVGISIQRKKVVGFLKLTAGVYIAFAFAMLAFFLGGETGARTGLLVGTLFAVLVNQRVAEAVLGRVEAFTLVDRIHVTAMVFLFAAAFVSLVTRNLHQQGEQELAAKVDRYGVIASTILYIAVNALIIWRAAVVG